MRHRDWVRKMLPRESSKQSGNDRINQKLTYYAQSMKHALAQSNRSYSIRLLISSLRNRKSRIWCLIVGWSLSSHIYCQRSGARMIIRQLPLLLDMEIDQERKQSIHARQSKNDKIMHSSCTCRTISCFVKGRICIRTNPRLQQATKLTLGVCAFPNVCKSLIRGWMISMVGMEDCLRCHRRGPSRCRPRCHCEQCR